jgi:glycosyltransferase involved in cell wall biosynthesis
MKALVDNALSAAGKESPGPALRIEAVEKIAAPGSRLAEARLNLPRAASASDSFAIEFRGWVPREAAVRSVQLTCFDEVLADTPADIEGDGDGIGFRTQIGAFRVPQRFGIEVRAVVEGHEPVAIARVTGTRASLGPSEESGVLTPVLVTTPTGRTGTTWLVHLLGTHPSLIAYAPFRVEPRPATYWVDAIGSLAEPASYLQSLRPRMENPHWFLGTSANAARAPIPDEEMAAFLGGEGVQRLAEIARERVEGFYRFAARQQGKEPRGFVEKGPFGRVRLEVIEDLFGSLRELVLFRDPRDTLCSILSYQARYPGATLVRKSLDASRRDHLEEIAASFAGMLGQAAERGDRTLVVRYEDVVERPRAALPRILEHLELDRSAETIEAMTDAALIDDERSSAHLTSASVAASVGRWQNELDASTRALATSVFRDVLGELQYDADEGRPMSNPHPPSKSLPVTKRAHGEGARTPADANGGVPGMPEELGPEPGTAAMEPLGQRRGVAEEQAGAGGSGGPAPEATIGMVRAVDLESWRYVYAIGDRPSGEVDGALGALRASAPPRQGIGVWLAPDGRVVTRAYDGVADRVRVRKVVRWILGPLVWGGPPPLLGRIALIARRFGRAFRRPWRRLRSEPERGGSPIGYLHREPGPGRKPLYSALHPVAGDQLLTTSAAEADELGYVTRKRLGYIVAEPPFVQALETGERPIPWSSRHGLRRGGGEHDAAQEPSGLDSGKSADTAPGTPSVALGAGHEPGGVENDAEGQGPGAVEANADGRGGDHRPPGAVIGLVRAVDLESWRHAYAIGDRPPGEIDGALGALRASVAPRQGIGIWLTPDGRVVTRAYDAVCDRPPVRKVLRWVLGPLFWGRPPSVFRRTALVARRWARSDRRPWRRLRSAPDRGGRPVGFLHREPGPGRKPLYSALHPVAGDQLLTTREEEAGQLGYLMPKRLGYIVAAAPGAHSLGTRERSIPWGSRDGLRRSGEERPLAEGALARPDPSVPEPVDGVRVAGWSVLGDEPVARVEILVNGEGVGLARLGIQRLGKARPDAPEWPVAGFDRRLAPSELPPSGSRVLLEALVTGIRGTELILSAPGLLSLEAPEAPLELPATNGARRDFPRPEAREKGGQERRGDELKVLAFSHRLTVGGAQRYLAEQLLRLSRSKGTTCAVVASDDGPWRSQLEEGGIEVFVGSEFPMSGRESYEAKIDELTEWASAHSFDVVFASTFDAYLGVDLATRLGLPSVWAIHESFDLATWWATHQRDDPDPYVRSRSLHALRSTNALLFAADATKPFYSDYADPQRMLTAPYGLELSKIDRFMGARDRSKIRRRLGLDDETTLIVCLAVIEPRKGQAVLARAWAQICDQHPNAHLALVGEIDSPYCEGLRRYVESTGLSERCTIVPATMDPYQWHHAADVYVLASEVESSPIAVLETMAFETLAVSSDVFGVPELIMHGEEGFLFRPNDVVDLASTLNRVLRLGLEERRRIAEAGARRVRERHDPDHYHRMLATALRQLAADPEARPRWETRA